MEFEYTRHELSEIANEVAKDLGVKPKKTHEAIARIVNGTSWKTMKAKVDGMAKIPYPGTADELRVRVGVAAGKQRWSV